MLTNYMCDLCTLAFSNEYFRSFPVTVLMKHTQQNKSITYKEIYETDVT